MILFVVYVDFDLFDEELDDFKTVSLDSVKDGGLFFMVFFFEVELEFKVQLLDDVKVGMHDGVVGNVKIFLFALIEEVGFFFG